MHVFTASVHGQPAAVNTTAGMHGLVFNQRNFEPVGCFTGKRCPLQVTAHLDLQQRLNVDALMNG